MARLTGAILVVEDDYYLALDISAAVRAAGGTVLGPCPDTATALSLVPMAQAATLDVRLREGERSDSVADALAVADVPFMFVTGYPADIPENHRTRTACLKYVSERQIVATLSGLCGDGSATTLT